jgi:hypothetical protein
VSVELHLRSGVKRWRIPFASLPFDDSPGSPWLLITPESRAAFDVLAGAGPPLARTSFGPPLLGVKCGCNEAFIVTVDDEQPHADSAATDSETVAVCVADRKATARRGFVERALLRPVVRGESLRAWGVGPAVEVRTAERVPEPLQHRQRHPPGRAKAQWIVWTHGGTDGGAETPLPALPVHAGAWLANWRHRLEARSDAQHQLPWWALFRTAGARSAATRVIWSDLGRRPRAAVLPAGDRTVPLNSCYVIPIDDANDAYALAAILNSEIAAAWLNVVAEPAANGYRRYLAWTVGLLPLPVNWPRARALLSPIGRVAAEGAPPADAALTLAVADAYGVALDKLEPLLTWTSW